MNLKTLKFLNEVGLTESQVKTLSLQQVKEVAAQCESIATIYDICRNHSEEATAHADNIAAKINY